MFFLHPRVVLQLELLSLTKVSAQKNAAVPWVGRRDSPWRGRQAITDAVLWVVRNVRPRQGEALQPQVIPCKC